MPLREHLKKAISKRVGAWLGWQLFLVLLYPFALMQIVLFWIRFARYEYLRGMNVFIVAVHFYALAGYSILVNLLIRATGNNEDGSATGFVILGVLFAVIAFVFHAIFGSLQRSKLTLLEGYYTLATNGSCSHVGQIASYTGRSPAAVTLGMEFMNQAGLLPILVNDPTGELYYDVRYGEASYAPQAQQTEYEQTWSAEPAAASDGGLVTVECPGCGSKSQIYRNRAATCEYCSSPLGEPAPVS